MEQFDLNEIAIFVKVVDAGSFTGAAKTLGLPKSTVSRKITQLEERLGARLLQRTTRTLSLTDTGSAYYNQCSRIIGDIEEANIAVTEMQSKPTGMLRITAPMLFGERILSNIVADFLKQYPEIQMDIVLTDQTLDLIQEGIDVAFRVGELADSSLIARNLGEVATVTVASPEYLAKHAPINHPNDLRGHDCISFQSNPHWEFNGPEKVSVDVKARVKVNDVMSMHRLAIEGMGVATLPTLVCAEDIKQKRLQPILCGWPFGSFPIHALYPSNRHLSVKVRTFVEYVVERLRSAPPWRVDLGDLSNDCPALKQ